MTFNRERFEEDITDYVESVWRELEEAQVASGTPYLDSDVCPTCWTCDHIEQNKTGLLSKLHSYIAKCEGTEILDLAECLAGAKANMIAGHITLRNLELMVEDLIEPI